MNDHSDLRLLYIIGASVAGSVTALSMLPWKTMSWPEIGMTVFVGMAFAIFAVPWIAADWVRIDINNLRAICGLTYFGATGANVFIPVIIRRFKRQLDGKDAA